MCIRDSASPMANATEVLVVGAKFNGHDSLSTELSKKASQIVFKDEFLLPIIPIKSIPLFFRWGAISSISRVSPLFDIIKARSFESAIPKSPCNASNGFKYRDVRPNEEKVAAIFLATIPLLPTPVVINLPIFLKHLLKA